jgi:hypothetical protein
MEEEATNKRNEVDIPTDNALVLILYCLTTHTLCSCKCVCRSWYRLIFEFEYHKELPQFVARFMYGNWKGNLRFASFTGEYPSFSFLPFAILDLVISDCCRGLFLC